MSATIFGTDGVRGTPGQYPLDERTIVRLGAATVRAQEVDDVTLLVALDTRESGPWIETQLARGVTAQRGHLVSAGIIPTPAAAFLAAAQSFDAALVISASHNPFPDNGIKLLTDTGEKASPALEARVEAMITDESWTIAEQVLPAIEARDLSDTYVAHAAAVLAGLAWPLTVPTVRPLSLRQWCSGNWVSTSLRSTPTPTDGTSTTVAGPRTQLASSGS